MTLQFQRQHLRLLSLAPARPAVRLGTMPRPPTLYLAGKFTSQMAQNALLAALLVTAGTSGDASIGLSGFFVAMLVPAIILGPFGGAAVDRLSPATAYSVGASLRALSILPAFFLFGSPHLVWVVAAAYSAASQVFTPAEFSLVHDVQGKKPGRMYSALTTAQWTGQGAGILLFAPALFFLGGQPAVFLGVVALFTLVSTIGLALVAAGVSKTEPASARGVSFRQVARFLMADGRAFYAVVALTLAGIISRVLVVSLPAYVRHEVNIGPLGLLFVVVPGVLGIIAALIWTSRTLSLARSERMLRASSLGLLAGLFLLAFVDHGVSLVAQNSYIAPLQTAEAWFNTTAAIVVPASFAGGFGLCVVVMSARFVLTELAPAGSRGRVHAVQLVITEALLVVPVMLAGITTALAGARLTLAIVGVLALGTLAATDYRRAVGQASRRVAPNPPETVVGDLAAGG